MIEILLNTSLFLAILLIIPAFIVMMLIIKEFDIHSILYSKYYKFFRFQVFIHSLYFVAVLFNRDFYVPFLTVSLTMLPIYLLLLLRPFHLKNQIKGEMRIRKEIALEAIQEEKRAQLKHSKLKPKLVARSTYKWR